MNTDEHRYLSNSSAFICVHLRLKNDEGFWFMTPDSCTGWFTELTGGKADTWVKPAPTTLDSCTGWFIGLIGGKADI
jgi:hypothetical protein